MSEQVESISWRRPGVLEIIISKIFKTKEPRQAPSLANLISGVSDARLTESFFKFEGAVSKIFFKYQAGVSFACPSNAEGSEAEKEQWSADVVLDQRNIATHPKIDAILKAGWGSLYQNKVFWPRMIYKDATEKDEEGNGQAKIPVKNPFYGIKYYFAPRIEIIREKFYESSGGAIDQSDLDAVGWMDSSNIEFVRSDTIVITGNTTRKTQGRRVLRTEWQTGDKFSDEVYKNPENK